MIGAIDRRQINSGRDALRNSDRLHGGGGLGKPDFARFLKGIEVFSQEFFFEHFVLGVGAVVLKLEIHR
ncbi:hypothetical protein QTI33_20740 [Variovorax sp. J22P271]|uniref:hypothetical protein n=1 Tax=Variovorax davisae TaxID=3053515 RepID=UPI002577D4E2|nr:hypothetical protein [Variovorax sp. J22P271]MDM0034577.1 hypothetical protein [Variovorax sp. J22P271]